MTIRAPLIIRVHALVGRWLPGRLATVWLCRSAAGPQPEFGLDLRALVDVMIRGRQARSRERARATVEELWAAGGEHRTVIWNEIFPTHSPFWRDDGHRLSNVWPFLAGPDPDSPHEPRIRLVTGLSTVPKAFGARPLHYAEVVHELARKPAVRAAVRDVLSRTDQPDLLSVMEYAFASMVERGGSALWSGGEPAPFLRLLLDHPHLPRRPASWEPPELALLMVMRARTDLLAGFEPKDLVGKLIALTASGRPQVSTAARHALRSFGPGPARDEVCRRAMAGSTAAIGAATELGYVPADPDLVPLFLVLTRQWRRFTALDPGGKRLRRQFSRKEAEAGARLVHLLSDDLPPPVRRACLRALAALRPGETRDRLCDHAWHDHDDHRRAVIESGLLPADPLKRPAFLAVTGQWTRYDAFDPDGRQLRAYAATLNPYSGDRDDLRAAARRAGRPMPCDAASTFGGSSSGYRAGGSGVAGTGGYTSGSF